MRIPRIRDLTYLRNADLSERVSGWLRHVLVGHVSLAGCGTMIAIPKFPKLIHAFKSGPDSSFPQAQTAHDKRLGIHLALTRIEAQDYVVDVRSRHPTVVPVHRRIYTPRGQN